MQPANICMGIVIGSIDIVSKNLYHQLKKIKVKVEISKCKIDWSDFYTSNGLSYDVTKAKIALFSESDSFTVYTSDLADGWISIFELLIKDGHFSGYFFKTTFDNSSIFNIHEMKAWNLGHMIRHVRALKAENGWEFLNKGNLLPFEKEKTYKNAKIINRLNSEHIENYSNAAGYAISNIVSHNSSSYLFYR